MSALALPWKLGLGLLGGLGGGFGRPQNQTTTQKGDTESQNQGWQNNYSSSDINSLLQTLSNLTTRSNATSTTAPSLGGPQQALLDQLTHQYSNLATSNTNLTPYAGQQTQIINRNSDLQSKAVQNAMAARGLATSPVSGTAEAGIQANRVGQINQLMAGLPLLQQQLRTQNLNAAGGFLSSVPRGMTTNTSSEGTQIGDTSQMGKTTGVNTSDTNYGGQSATQNNQIGTQQVSSGGGLGGFFGGLGGVLASLFG